MRERPKSGLLQELCEYIEGIHKSRSYDLVVGIERRGLALYREAFANCLSNHAKSVPVIPAKAVNGKSVSGKDILLFDDIIRTEETIRKNLKRLKSSGARRVDIATFLKVASSTVQTLPPKHLLKDEPQEFKYTDRITALIDSLLVPIDEDHIYVKGHLDKVRSRKRIRETLDQLGRVHPSDDNIPKSDLQKLDIDDLNFLPVGSLKLPRNVTMPQWRMRFDFLNSEKICFFPIAFPHVIYADKVPQHNAAWCFCNKYLNSRWKADHDEAEWLMFLWCLIFDRSVALLEAFLRTWNRLNVNSGTDFVIEEVIFDPGESSFQDPQLHQHLRLRLDKALKESRK